MTVIKNFSEIVTRDKIANQKLLYQGSDSSVYVFNSIDGDKQVLKVLNSSLPSSTQIAQFNSELFITQRIHSGGVRKVLGQTMFYNCPAMIMEYFDGTDLEDFVKEGIDVDSFLDLGIRLAEILGNIHLDFVTHKDINGRNILIDPSTRELRLIDFGMSSMLYNDHQAAEHPNLIRGTMTHISPEQTGRMNRKVDYRSDIYSLGVTFYHMLTGVYPFLSDDPLEMMHYHIAREPDLKRLQYPLNLIIGKMLAKNADERYNSAFGLRNDLMKCASLRKEKQEIVNFKPGSNDLVLTFTIRQKLYGRKEETDKLLEEFELASNGETRMLLVAGYSGVGKTTLINEIHRPLSTKKGFLGSGKFDQYHRNVPYYAFIQAFQLIADQLLTETEERLKQWKEKILQAVGINGQLIIDVIPAFKHIIGEQETVQEMLASESNNRFNRVFLNFITVFAAKEHPLVLFMDDLQWADIASLKLIEQLIFQATDHHLLLLGAYRDNEVDQAHPLTQSLEAIQKNHGFISTIQLKPLASEEINQLVSDSIESSLERTQPLSDLVFNKTGGNPFFVSQFMYKLYNDGRLTFSSQNHEWVWNLETIKRENITDNVGELMTSNILKLPPESQEIIKLAACIGNEFDLQTLARVSNGDMVSVNDKLWPSLQIGLVRPLDDNYKIFSTHQYDNVLLAGSNAKFSFLHDRIQQAAYLLIDKKDKPSIHLNIGRNLLVGKSEEEIEDHLFDILNHINEGVSLVTTPHERLSFANLNQRAGKKAKASAAYASALKFYDKAVEFLGEDGLSNSYESAFPVYLELAEVAYLSGDIPRAESLQLELLGVSATRADKVKVYILQSIMYLTIGNMAASKDACKSALVLFDISVPEVITNEIIFELFGQIETLRAGRPIPSLIDLPELTDPDQSLIFVVLFNFATPAFYTDQMLWTWIIFMEIVIAIKNGNSDFSDAVYGAYGIILGTGFGDYDSGFEYGELGLHLNEKFNNVANRSKLCVVFGQMNSHWKRHYKGNLPTAIEGFNIGNETGDLAYAGYSAFHLCWCLFLLGRPLKDVIEECNRFESYFVKTKSEIGFSTLVEKQLALALGGQTNNLHILSDAYFNEEEFVEKLKTLSITIPLHTYYISKERLSYHAGLYADVLNFAALAKPVNFPSLSVNYFPEECFFEVLANIALARDNNTAVPAEINPLIEKINKWAHHSPDNFLHKSQLIQAEMLSFQNAKEASEMYDYAISQAHASEFIHEEALANELAAMHHFRANNIKLAKAYLTESRNQYRSWGAMGKVRILERTYPHLLYNQGVAEYSPSKASNLISATQDVWVEPDIQTILKASTALSGEVKIDSLLRTLLNIAIENAGAQKGVVLLKEKNDFLVKAQKNSDGSIQVLQDVALQDAQSFAKSVVHYVIRTEESVVVDNALETPRYANDAYVISARPKSVLCMPIISKGDLTGILYLENNLTTNAFTAQRLDLLKLISGQIAISIDNASLYENLEKKVRERTEELLISKEVSDKLLRNILPEETAEELKKTGTAIPKSYEQVSILFTDFKGFTKASEKLSPAEIIAKLDYCFANFDRIIAKHNLEKIKTIGDSYMCAGGIPAANSTNALDAVRAGLEIQEFMTEWNKQEQLQHVETWQLRVGINTGKVIAGVVGQSKFAYDIWGDAVNLANAMEQAGEVGKVNISSSTYELVKNDFVCLNRGKIRAKNKGEVDMYFVQSK